MEEDEINIVPGLEGVMQRKDIPHVVARVDTPSLQFLINEMHITTQAIGFILNTFDDLESPCLPHLGTFYNKIYTIGPVHAFLSSKLKHLSKSTTPILAKPEQNCLAWLDSQPTKSVIYVSFGTLLKITRSELLELWHGLVDSGYPFLWAIREDFTLNSEGENENEVPFKLEMGINGKGFIVSWAPQEQVLNHKSIRGFFTHAGWNSVLESIVAKVPMMYWSGSHVGDLYLNSLCMKKLWRIGIELETLERLKIKEKIKIFMESSPKDDDGIQISVLDKISKSALDAIGEGGSSYCNFEELVRVIKNLAKC